MWFGDLVTMRWWDDLWLNESFAELLGTLTVDEATDLPGSWAAFTVSRKAWGYAADQLPTTHPVATDVGDSQSALLNFDGISYAKGASVLRQLMAYVGREAFFDRRAVLPGQARVGQHDAGRPADRAGGQQRARAAGVGRRWLRTTGVSTLQPVWDGDALAVEQESPTPRVARIGVGRWDLTEGVLRRRDLTEVDVGPGTTPVSLTGPRPGLLLLNDGDLAFVKIRFDERSAQTLVRHLHTIDDDLSRALCWAALWDSTRDAELPAWAYVETVLAGAAVEDDPAQVQTLLGQATTAATRYVPAGDRAELLRRLADAWWASAAAATPGGDLQLGYVKAFLAGGRRRPGRRAARRRRAGGAGRGRRAALAGAAPARRAGPGRGRPAGRGAAPGPDRGGGAAARGGAGGAAARGGQGAGVRGARPRIRS